MCSTQSPEYTPYINYYQLFKKTMKDIKVSETLNIKDSALNQYILHLTCWNGHE